MSEDPPASRFFSDRADLREGEPFLLPGARRRPVSYFEAACREARNLSEEEDCYELRLFRLFRDEYVVRRPDGEGKSTAGYREESARVLRAIERLPADAAHEAYLSIYETGVLPIVALILDGSWDEAYDAYAKMHRELKARFLPDGKQAR